MLVVVIVVVVIVAVVIVVMVRSFKNIIRCNVFPNHRLGFRHTNVKLIKPIHPFSGEYKSSSSSSDVMIEMAVVSSC